MTHMDGKAAAAELRAKVEGILAEERAAGYDCKVLPLPEPLRARRGCRACGQTEEGVPYNVCFLTRRHEEKKVLLFSFLSLCKECAGDDDARRRVADLIFDQGTLEPLQ